MVNEESDPSSYEIISSINEDDKNSSINDNTSANNLKENKSFIKRFIKEPIAKGVNALHNKFMINNDTKNSVNDNLEEDTNKICEEYDIISPVNVIDLPSDQDPNSQEKEGTGFFYPIGSNRNLTHLMDRLMNFDYYGETGIIKRRPTSESRYKLLSPNTN